MAEKLDKEKQEKEKPKSKSKPNEKLSDFDKAIKKALNFNPKKKKK